MDFIGLIANIGSTVTLFVALYWFYKDRERNYFKSELPGNYKIFSGLKSQEDTNALHHLTITSTTSNGWFFGTMEYSEIFKDPGTQSAGECNFIGKIDYSYRRILKGWVARLLNRQSFHPLEEKDSASFHGTIHFMSRNDFDVSKTSWKTFVIVQYSIIHYRHAYRLKLYNPSNDSYMQILSEITLVNTDRVPDSTFSSNFDKK